jgi:hypothetical protein
MLVVILSTIGVIALAVALGKMKRGLRYVNWDRDSLGNEIPEDDEFKKPRDESGLL